MRIKELNELPDDELCDLINTSSNNIGLAEKNQAINEAMRRGFQLYDSSVGIRVMPTHGFIDRLDCRLKYIRQKHPILGWIFTIALSFLIIPFVTLFFCIGVPLILEIATIAGGVLILTIFVLVIMKRTSDIELIFKENPFQIVMSICVVTAILLVFIFAYKV